MNDTEESLLAFYDEVRARKAKLQECPQGNPQRAALLAFFNAGKAEYSRRKVAFEQSIKVSVGEASSNNPAKVAATNAITTRTTSTIAHKDNLNSKSVEQKDITTSLMPTPTLEEHQTKGRQTTSIEQARSPPTDEENVTAEKPFNSPAFVELEREIKDVVVTIKQEAKAFVDAIKLLSDSANAAGHVLGSLSAQMDKGNDDRSRNKEVASHMLGDIIERGTVLFERAINAEDPTPSSQAEKESVKRVRDLLWAGLTALQKLNNRSTPPSLKGAADVGIKSQNEDSRIDIAELEDRELSPGAGKRKFEVSEEEPPNNSEECGANKRLRSSSKV